MCTKALNSNCLDGPEAIETICIENCDSSRKILGVCRSLGLTTRCAKVHT